MYQETGEQSTLIGIMYPIQRLLNHINPVNEIILRPASGCQVSSSVKAG